MQQRHTVRFDLRLLVPLLILALLAIASFTPVAPRVAKAANLCGTWDTDWTSSSAYYVQNNVWGASTSQCVNTTSSTSWTVTASHNNATNGAPASYPSVIKGCHSRDLNPNQNQLCTTGWTHYQTTAISAATISWSFGVPGSGNWDAAMDIWYGPSQGTYSGTEIMIWLNYLGPIQPIGGKIASAVSLDGTTWDVWTGTTSGGSPSVSWKVISYVRTTKVTSVTNLNLKTFQDDAISRNQLNSAHYLTGIDAGFEIWSGTGFSSSSFSASVTGSTGPTATRTATSAAAPTATRTATPTTASSSGTTVCGSVTPTLISNSGDYTASTTGSCYKVVNSSYPNGAMMSVRNVSSSNTSVKWYGKTSESGTTCATTTHSLSGNGAQINNFAVDKNASNEMYVLVTSTSGSNATVNISIATWQNGSGCP